MSFDFVFDSIRLFTQLNITPYLVISFVIFSLIRLFIFICTGSFFKKGGN